MKKQMSNLLFFVLALFVAGNVFAGSTNIIINNVDGAGVGLNDPTVVAPVGGNSGTTLGQQRLNVFTTAAGIWGNTLTSSVDVIVQATMEDRGFTPCTSTGAVLGAAGTIQIFADFPNAIWDTHWYHSALANKLAGADITPGPPDPSFLAVGNDDIIAFFNPNIGTPGCLDTSSWYYGLDNNAGAGQIDFLNVVLHEMGHGLGFANFVNDDGTMINGLPDVYTAYTHDNDTGKQWNQMNDGERGASTVNTDKLVWNGPTVHADLPFRLDFGVDVIITDPVPLAGKVEAGPASFGPPISTSNFSGDVVLADDGGGAGTATDACEPLTNGGAINGNVALVDRGLCNFNVKAQNAQAAGATAVIIANTLGRGVFNPGGTDPTITIPVVGISNDDGDDIKAALPGVAVIAQTDFDHRAGADEDNHALLYAPNPVQPGSSVSHYDVSATPNALMEPAINGDLKGATDLDLTPSLMTDEGWDGQLHCPDNSDSSPTVFINGCDSGVTNTQGPYTTFPKPKKHGNVAAGCTIADTFNACNQFDPTIPEQQGDYKKCVAAVAKQLVSQDVITKDDKNAIVDCATP